MLLALLLACAHPSGAVRTSLPSGGDVVIAPPVPAYELGMMDHVTVVGWSTDGQELGWCVDAMVRQCTFQRLDGATETLSDRPSPASDEADPALAAAIDARIAARGYGTAKAGAVPGLVLTWAVTPGEIDGRAAVVEAGAAGAPSPLPLRIEEPGFDRIHVEYLGVSPDGSHVGLVSHAFRGEYSDTFRIAIVGTDALTAAR